MPSITSATSSGCQRRGQALRRRLNGGSVWFVATTIEQRTPSRPASSGEGLLRTEVEDTDAVGGWQRVVLFHYAIGFGTAPLRCWHLFGHSHGTLPDIPGSLAIDVAWTATTSRPSPTRRLKAILQARRHRRRWPGACVCGEGTTTKWRMAHRSLSRVSVLRPRSALASMACRHAP